MRYLATWNVGTTTHRREWPGGSETRARLTAATLFLAATDNSSTLKVSDGGAWRTIYPAPTAA